MPISAPEPVGSPGPASPALERFARETLGCRCEPQVFERVEDDPVPPNRLPEVVRRFRIGGRLLIWLVRPGDGALAAGSVQDWVAAGRAERDRLGMNRLRLAVLLPSGAAGSRTDIEGAFSRCVNRDERVHLHLLPLDAAAEL